MTILGHSKGERVLTKYLVRTFGAQIWAPGPRATDFPYGLTAAGDWWRETAKYSFVSNRARPVPLSVTERAQLAPQMFAVSSLLMSGPAAH